MALTGGIKVTGAKETRRALRGFGDDLSDLKDVHTQIARMVVTEAQGRAPVRFGALRRSIRGSGTQTRATVKAGKKRVPYAGPIHFGWPDRNIKPQPFLYEALDSRKGEVIDNYKKAVDKAVRKYDRVGGK
jgi:hypothetical protein